MSGTYRETWTVNEQRTIEVEVEGAMDEGHARTIIGLYMLDAEPEGQRTYLTDGLTVSVSVTIDDSELEDNDDGEWEADEDDENGIDEDLT